MLFKLVTRSNHSVLLVQLPPGTSSLYTIQLNVRWVPSSGHTCDVPGQLHFQLLSQLFQPGGYPYYGRACHRGVKADVSIRAVEEGELVSL